jgi:hypothetical protein
VFAPRDEKGRLILADAGGPPDHAAHLRAVAKARGWPEHQVERWVREHLGRG